MGDSNHPTGTRGARKLVAALERFGLARALRGAHAIDVGASTGGFTATMLASGAAEVTAIDVGAGQLARALRDDPRVHAFEHTDFRRAALALAPGPFDFFSVDVSFMAARNVLRPLAFRLRDGAEGVVLLKPQFELPKSRVRGGVVTDENDRRAALERFGARAEQLGFELRAHVDSPVAGGSGSVEMLLHVRFRGRTARMPALGERKVREPGKGKGKGKGTCKSKSGRTQQGRVPAATDDVRWFAVAAPGLEAALAQELQAIELLPAGGGAGAGSGGVELSGPLAAGFIANLRSRIATRVLLRLGEVDAREFAVLRHRAAKLPFERWLPRTLPVRVDVATNRCRLYHTAAIAEQVLLAAGDRLGKKVVLKKGRDQEEGGFVTRPYEEGDGGNEEQDESGLEPFARLLVRGSEDRFVISLDSSGALLHRRGARVETGRAPLRETLAAGMLALAGYRGDEPLVNAMCGSGTIALEAAAIALEHAPGRRRRFALERFPLLEQEPALRAALEQERARAAAQERAEPPAALYAFDRDPAAVERTRRNAERAGVALQLNLRHADIRELAPPCERGLLIANPPYGKRLGAARQARAGYLELARVLRERWRGFRVALLLPRDLQPAALGLRRAQTYPLLNGGIPVTLLVAQL
jgi:putative N6-adenine-specific DNA methylase